MENHVIVEASTEQIVLHAGFRFHPTNEELIVCYLVPKSLNAEFKAIAIGEADLRKMEPWELPWVANMGEEEWYFFCRTEKRYPTGQRTNRGTKSGYWKATGKDQEIYSGKVLVGRKKTLVFYQGRAPKSVKSNWVMHEFRLDGKYSKDNLHESAQSEWVISRVFHKNSSGKKTHISPLPDPISQLEDVNQLPGNGGFDAKPPSTATNPIPSSLPLPHFSDQLLIDENGLPSSLTAELSNYTGPQLLIDENGLLDSLTAELSNYTGPGGGCGEGDGGGYLADDWSVFFDNTDDWPVDEYLNV